MSGAAGSIEAILPRSAIRVVQVNFSLSGNGLEVSSI